jgi:hypothetical protein
VSADENYKRGAELTYVIVAAWTHPGGPPLFAFPPRDYTLLADLRDVGAKLARNESARDLLQRLVDLVVRATGHAPTAMMLRVILEELGHPIEWVPFTELKLGVRWSLVRTVGAAALEPSGPSRGSSQVAKILREREFEAISKARSLLSKLSGRIEITDELRVEIDQAETALWDVLFPGGATPT